MLLKPSLPLLVLFSTLFCTAFHRVDAKLAHRWSFNGNLEDRIGGQTAQIRIDDPDSNKSRPAKLSDTSISLKGGNYLYTEYVDLGGHLFDGSKQITIEIWATQMRLMNWSRIFSINGTAEIVDANTDMLFMTWDRLGTITLDRVEFALQNGEKLQFGNESNAPYELEREYHIVMTLDNYAPNSTRVTWYSAPADAADIGPAKGSFVSEINLDEFNDAHATLGRSTWNNPIANATYNEVRIYHSALSPAEVEASHDAGVNGIKVDIPEPQTAGLIGAITVLLYASIRRRKRGSI